MGRNLYKLTKFFEFITSSSVLTAKKVEGFQGFLLNISKTIQLILTKLISLFR